MPKNISHISNANKGSGRSVSANPNPAMDNDILDEVREDLTQENFFKFLTKYGAYVLIVIAIIIIAMSVYVYINHRNQVRQEAISYEYYKLFNSSYDGNKLSEYQKNAQKLMENDHSVYAYLASFKYADSLVSDAKYDMAADVLLGVMNKATKVEISNIAELKLIELSLSHSLSNKASIVEKINAHTEHNKGPFGNTIRLLQAQLLLDSKDTAKAKSLLDQIINDDSAAEDMKFFASVILNSNRL